jgi:hypothetical protein
MTTILQPRTSHETFDTIIQMGADFLRSVDFFQYMDVEAATRGEASMLLLLLLIIIAVGYSDSSQGMMEKVDEGGEHQEYAVARMGC